MKFKPKHIDGKYYWQCNYDGAPKNKYTLKKFVWNLLKSKRVDNVPLVKWYDTEKEAFDVLDKAHEKLIDYVDELLW